MFNPKTYMRHTTQLFWRSLFILNSVCYFELYKTYWIMQNKFCTKWLKREIVNRTFSKVFVDFWSYTSLCALAKYDEIKFLPCAKNWHPAVSYGQHFSFMMRAQADTKNRHLEVCYSQHFRFSNFYLVTPKKYNFRRVYISRHTLFFLVVL